MSKIEELKRKAESAKNETRREVSRWMEYRFNPGIEYALNLRRYATETLTAYIVQKAEKGGADETETAELASMLMDINPAEIRSTFCRQVIETTRNIIMFYKSDCAPPQERGRGIWETIQRNTAGLVYHKDGANKFMKTFPPLIVEEAKQAAEILTRTGSLLYIDKLLDNIHLRHLRLRAVEREAKAQYYRELERIERLSGRVD